jgi:hypothetical protein
MGAVAAHGAMLTAIGTWHHGREGQPLGLSTWVSSDAGATWIEQPRDEGGGRVPTFAAQLLTAADIGFVTVHFTSFPEVLVSPDGTTWDELEGANDIAKAQFRDLAGRGDTLVAVGLEASSTRSTFLTPDAWTYTEAAGWTALNDRFSGAIVGDLVADASGFYAAGMVLPDPETTAGSLATVWASKDGRSWQQRILSEAPEREAGPIAHGSLGRLVMGDALVPSSDDAATTFAWFVPNDAPDAVAQEYPIAWSGRAAVALPDRFLVFGVCPRDAKDCTGPAMLTFSSSDEPYQQK